MKEQLKETRRRSLQILDVLARLDGACKEANLDRSSLALLIIAGATNLQNASNVIAGVESGTESADITTPA